MEETGPRSPNLKTCGQFVSNYVYRTNFSNSFIIYFGEAKIMVGINYTTFYLPLLKLVCILLKIEIYNAGSWTRGREPLPQFFSTKNSFCSFFTTFFPGDVLLFQT